ncbi:MAG TPA: MATE family efflux transporter [Pseudomonadales bacterium]
MAFDQKRAYTPNGQAIERPAARRLTEGAPLPLLLRLAAPNALAFLTQAVVSVAELAIIGRLGTAPLAALALMFPALMLMQMLANGAFGGAVASAAARAIGAGDADRAAAVGWHALYLAAAAGLLLGLGYALAGPWLLDASGAPAAVTEAAHGYARVVFAGAPLIWLVALASALYRGVGEMRFPALLMVAGGAAQVVITAALAFGTAGLPRLGLAGAAVAVVLVAAVNAAILLWRLARGRIDVRLPRRAARPSRRILTDVLRVGAPAALSPVLTVATVVTVNALVSGLGPERLAGYGIVTRLELLLIPLVFGLGVAMTAAVGASVGAGDVRRAERVGWTGAAVAAGATGIIGLLLALRPGTWLGLFTDDPAIWAAGAGYLRLVGPVFAFQGLGLSLYFASQGAGAMFWPVLATLLRFLLAAGGGSIAVHRLGAGLDGLYVCLALGMFVYGAVTAASIALGAWRRVPARFASAARAVR